MSPMSAVVEAVVRARNDYLGSNGFLAFLYLTFCALSAPRDSTESGSPRNAPVGRVNVA
jgi:hypothetical protein